MCRISPDKQGSIIWLEWQIKYLLLIPTHGVICTTRIQKAVSCRGFANHFAKANTDPAQELLPKTRTGVLLLSLSNESIFYNVWISPSQTHQSNPVWHSWNSSPTLGGLKFHKCCQADILQSLWIVCKSKQLEPTKCMDYKRASVLAYDPGLLFISISISSCCHTSCFLCISSWLIFKSWQRFLSHTSWWYAHDFWPNQVLWGKCNHSVIALHLAHNFSSLFCLCPMQNLRSRKFGQLQGWCSWTPCLNGRSPLQ